MVLSKRRWEEVMAVGYGGDTAANVELEKGDGEWRCSHAEALG